MFRCTDCRPLILDRLFGLLDAAEASAVDAHLAGCAACAAERAKEAKLQGLIATAAKSEFPRVRFDAPAVKPAWTKPVPATSSASPERPTVLAVPANPHRNRDARKPSRAARSLPWAVAAAVLIVVPGTIIPVLDLLNNANTAHVAAADAKDRASVAFRAFETANQEAPRRLDPNHALLAARQAHDGLLASWVKAEKAAAQAHDTRELSWEVRKPAAVQPGAPNEFLLVVRSGQAEHHSRLLAEVREVRENQTDAVIFSQPLEHDAGRGEAHPIRLPVSVWSKLTPQSELFLVVSRVEEKTGEKTQLQDKVRLLGPVFATVLTSDKAAYQPGETVYFRSLTLDRVTFTPPTRDLVFQYELLAPNRRPVPNGVVTGGTELVRVSNGKVEVVNGPDGKTLRGVGAGAFILPTDAPDGDYTLLLKELPHPDGTPPAVPFAVTRTLKVRAGASDEYRKLTGYSAASYSAGGTVKAWAELRFRDKPVVGAQVLAVATADGQPIPGVKLTSPATGPDGRANLEFTLPAELDRGDVRLMVTFKPPTDNGNAIQETVVDRVPVVGRRLIVEFFPEGGDLMAGVPSRVYVRATTPDGQPVDITGTITDGHNVLATVATVTGESQHGANRGIGSFTFTPKLGGTVWLKLASPSGFYSPLLPPKPEYLAAPAALVGGPTALTGFTGFPLPAVHDNGVTMTVLNPVTAPGEPICVHLRSVGKDRNLVVGAYTRGRLSDTQRVTATIGRVAEVKLMAGSDPRGGVVRITVFEEPKVTAGDAERRAGEAEPDLLPVAERLVFRKPGETLKLDFTANGTRGGNGSTLGFVAGTAVELNISATDEKGRPAAAILYTAVVNTGVAPGAKDRLLTTHFLLSGDINTPDAMEYADFLLTDHPKAAESLDLVLATQGWRRFAEQIGNGYAKRPVATTQECANLLVSNGQYMTGTVPASHRVHNKLRAEYWPKYEAAVVALKAAEANANAAIAKPANDPAVETARQLASAANEARDEAKASADRVAAATIPVARFRGAGWFAVAAFGLLATMLGVACFARPTGRLPLGIGTVGSLGLVVFLVAALGMADRTHAAGNTVSELAIAKVPAPPAGLQAALGRGEGSDKIVTDAGTPGGLQSKGTASNSKGATEVQDSGSGNSAPGLAGGGFGGNGVRTNGVQVVNVLPPAKDQGERKNTQTGRPTVGVNPIAPPQPSAPGGLPTAGGTAVGSVANDSGWRPGENRNQIPDESLLWLRDAYFFDLRMKADAVGRRSGNDKAARTEDTAKVEAEAKCYRQAIEKAKEYKENQKNVIRDEMKAAADRKQLTVQLPQAEVPPLPGGTALGKMQLTRVPPEVLALKRVQDAVPNIAPLVIREYAGPRPGAALGVPTGDEVDTVLWQPVIVLPGDGKATLHFQLGSAPGGYQVVIAGHSFDGKTGRIGAMRGLIPVVPVAPTIKSESAPQVVPAPVTPNKP